MSPPAPHDFAPELKGMDSVDLPGPRQEPADPLNCRIETTVRVGPAHTDGADNFTLYFATPTWLAEHRHASSPEVPEYTLILEKFTWAEAGAAVRQLMASVDARSWQEFVETFSQHAYWEFSDRPIPS